MMSSNLGSVYHGLLGSSGDRNGCILAGRRDGLCQLAGLFHHRGALTARGQRRIDHGANIVVLLLHLDVDLDLVSRFLHVDELARMGTLHTSHGIANTSETIVEQLGGAVR